MKNSKGILTFASHNIQGSFDRKIQFHEILSFVANKDIVCFQETWLTESNILQIPGYSIFRSDRKTSKNKNSGGVVIIYKSILSKGIQKIKSKNNDFLWIKLNKSFFGLECDLYLCNCYIPPQSSRFHDDLDNPYFNTLKDEISMFSSLGEIILCGDFNSRVGEIQESVYDVENDVLSRRYIDNNEFELPFRHNEDKEVNSFGRKLIKFLNETNLMIINGRKLGDSVGSKTCYKYNGSSVVDYFITTYNLFSNVLNFIVDNQTWYSDHSPLSLSLKTNRYLNSNIQNNYDLERIGQYQYKDPHCENFKKLLNSDDSHCEFQKILKSNISCPDKILNEFKSIIYNVADKTLPFKCVSKCNYKIKKPVELELGKDYNELKNVKYEFTCARRNLDKDKSNVNRRLLFITARKNYRKLKYLLFNKNKEKSLHILADMEMKDPKGFWKSVKKLINPHQITGVTISPDSWVSYFKKLLNLNQNTKSPFLDYVESSLPSIEKEANDVGPLDFEITIDELNNTLKTLKNNKSPGPDKIRNEMFKDGDLVFQQTLLHVFNVILKSGKYPFAWKTSYILPIHKAKDTEDPENYRGIALSDSISKIFCKIIDVRVVDYLKEKGILKCNQNGFQKNLRTEDNIFILKTLLDKYVKKNKSSMYVAFIDFKKFFDTINRKALFYKMLKYGIYGNLYNIVKNAYDGCTYKVKTRFGLTKGFVSNNGVKQGCVLSPTLSNLFQNDLHDIFNDNCYPVQLGSILLNSLSFADDLILLSETPQGLQECLNRLEEYCSKWGLTVSSEKSKCMIAASNINHKSDFCFSINGSKIENVESFKYLGLLVSSNGNVNKMINDRIVKAKRAMFMLKKALNTSTNVSVKLATSLFDKSISPILLYGCSIWGMPENRNIISMKFDKIPMTNVKSFVCEKLNSISCNFEYDDIIISRINRETETINIKLFEPVLMYHILDCYIKNKNSVNFCIEHCIKDKKSNIEKIHANFCKFALGVSKYTSTTLSLGELGRFPIEIKMYSQCVLYWLRMVKGSNNFLLQEAYNDCVAGNHEWYLSICHFLQKNGLGHILENCCNLEKNYVKAKINNRLKDQYIQYYNNYLSSDDDFYSKIVLCTVNENEEYKQKCYVDRIYNCRIRSKLTRFRIGNRHSKVRKEKCSLCNNVNDIYHELLHCNNNDVSRLRSQFFDECGKFVKDFKYLNDRAKLKIILNASDKNIVKNDALGIICNYIDKISNFKF